MTIVNPISTSNLVAQAQTAHPVATEEKQIDLRPEQIVRATVVEGGLDKALLEMNHQQLRAQSDIELQVGQNLTLQVLRTHPQLEFRILNDPLAGRLNQLLPLLSSSYDWGELLQNLQQLSQPNQLPATMPQVFNQLQQLLQPLGFTPDQLQEEIGKLAAQLQQLGTVPEPETEVPFLPPFNNVFGGEDIARQYVPAATSYSSSEQVILLVNRLVQDLQSQLELPQVSENEVVPQQLLSKVDDFLNGLQAHMKILPQLPANLQTELFAVVQRAQQQPSLAPQQINGLARLAVQLAALQAHQAVQTGGITLGTDEKSVESGQITNPSQPQPAMPSQEPVVPQQDPKVFPQVILFGGDEAQSQKPPAGETAQPVELAAVTDGIEKLLSQIRQLQTDKGGITPDLAGRLEGLLEKLQLLTQQPQTAESASQGLKSLLVQMGQMSQQDVIRPEGGQLGFLSQLFGFHLETELLNGKKKEALASLKLALLSLRDELGKKAEEPLHRLEILQMCKAKLHNEQVQFLPLPFQELEEGYLLVEKRRKQEQEEKEDAPLQLSISLRLSALGNMRIDMLYEKDSLQLRVACENQEKMRYLQDARPELESAIETVQLRGVSFAADAQVPARQLLKRLMPAATGLLDSRI